MANTIATPLRFSCGLAMKNRFMLAPMTNTQSYEDGRLSDDEYKWLTMRAKGQFGIVMTCASHVQAIGKGFPGQLGIFSDSHIEGHQRLSKAIQSYGSLAVVQLHHAGMRSPARLIQQAPVSPSPDEETAARELTVDEVQQLKEDFILAAQRARQSGYDGVEVHGAHGYILTQFLSAAINKRTDDYGGSLDNRARLLFEIVEGIRSTCGASFLVGVRLSPEGLGLDLMETRQVCERLIDEAQIDFLDISLWDVKKMPEAKEYQHQPLLHYFTQLERKDVRLTVAGKIRNGEDVHHIIDSGVDFATIGRSAILHHDFPEQVIQNAHFKPVEIPVSREYLRKEGLGENFIAYMSRWQNFVE